MNYDHTQMNGHMVHTTITVCLSTLGSSILEVYWEGLVMKIAPDGDITCLFLDELHHTQMDSHMAVTEITTAVQWPPSI